MRVSPISFTSPAASIQNTRVNSKKVCSPKYTQQAQKKQSDGVTFGYFFKSYRIANGLKKRYNMECSFGMNDFAAECTERTVRLFDDLFGRNSLPNEASFVSFSKKFGYGKDTLGLHTHPCGEGDNAVYFNSDCKCYRTRNRLKFAELTDRLVWWRPTANYLQTFVHEFGHSAHYKHLCEDDRGHVMAELSDMQIHDPILRLIAKFFYGRYCATNMNEFMAERITKDVCKHLNKYDSFVGSRENIDYEDIFENKWNSKYTKNPQAYLDCYTQQVWNGDLDGADNAADKTEHFLEKVERMGLSEQTGYVNVKALNKGLDKRMGLLLNLGGR